MGPKTRITDEKAKDALDMAGNDMDTALSILMDQAETAC